MFRQNRPLNPGVCLDLAYITTACQMVAEMVESLPSVLALGHKRNSNTPAFLTSVLRNIVISLARLPLVNSYTRVPPLVSLVVPWQKDRNNEMCRPAPGWGLLGVRVGAHPSPASPGVARASFRACCVWSWHLSGFLGHCV